MSFIDYTSLEKNYLPDFITLTRAKTINLSKGLLKKNNLNRLTYNYVQLSFDPPANRIRIRFAKNKQDDYFKITYDKRDLGASIACGNFVNFFNVNLSKYAGKYSYKDNSAKDEKIFIINLKSQENGIG